MTIGDNPGCNQSVIVRPPSRGTKFRRLEDLVEAGLISVRTESVGRTVKFYNLTEDGMRFYRLWRQFESGGDLPTDYDTSLAQGAEAK